MNTDFSTLTKNTFCCSRMLISRADGMAGCFDTPAVCIS